MFKTEENSDPVNKYFIMHAFYDTYTYGISST